MIKRNRRYRTRARYPWTTRGLVVLGSLFGVMVVGAFVFDDMGLSKYLAMRKQAGLLEQEIQELEKSNAALRQEVERVQHDPARIEELARDQLGLVRKGETVYQIVESQER